jgi:L-lactate dehydrogenase complex protein LldG
MSAREAFLERVRRAVHEGNRHGAAAPLPERGAVGYQGAGADPLATFIDNCRTMGMQPALVQSRDELIAQIGAILDAKGARKILLGRGDLVDQMAIGTWLSTTGREAILPNAAKETLFAAEASITEVTALIAETGSLVVAAGSAMSRCESLLPPLHIAVARPSQIVPDVFDALEIYSATKQPPSNLVFITGPSKTGDIELKLVTGVHGPGAVHVFIIDEQKK